MSSESEGASAKACWFVGAQWGSGQDQTQRFLEEGIWENGYKDRYIDEVNSIKPDDRIAIKSSYTRKHGLPFKNRRYTVSVMAIKAIGTVTGNLGDGRTIKVDWTRLDSPREWYFSTHRQTIWRVLPGDWISDALISFTFDGKPQDYDRFRNEPYWRGRFGDGEVDKSRFKWTTFYENIADKLVNFKDNREELVAQIHTIAANVDGLSNLKDQFKDGTSGPLKDICPFTTMGVFNRGITDANRKIIAAELGKFLGVDEPVPQSFEGIPVLNNMKSWFFDFEINRKSDDIDVLWNIFVEAIRFAESDDPDTRLAFIKAYDDVTQRAQVGRNITMGLYWIRPWNYPTLDKKSKHYINNKLGIQIGLNGPKHNCNANDYLAVLDTLKSHFQEEAYPVHSFTELALEAWFLKDSPADLIDTSTEDTQSDDADLDQETEISGPIEQYSVENILADGCFIEQAILLKILERLNTKKNLILQGPPGTGKTWLAKRLAFALMGQKNDSKVKVMQFHPNLSYEDFVRGWRPSGDGKLSLVDGPFMEMVTAALTEPKAKHIIVIEEINRGNPAQIFGEMLTLLETDKRTTDAALELCYRRTEGEHVFIPDNLYLIGTMNIADRSLALVDLALRRRFAFIDLKPELGKTWYDWVQMHYNINPNILLDIGNRILLLNDEISADRSLGPQFQIGHSYVTPHIGMLISDAREWFRDVVKTEIGPLLDEYWYDDLDKSKKAKERLIEGF